MRWYPLGSLIIILIFAAAHAGAQTFTIEQPKSSKRVQTKVIRPGEVSVAPQPKASATHSKSSVKFEEENGSPSAARTSARSSAKRSAVKTTKRAAPAPPPVEETEVASAPAPKKPAPPPLEPVPSINSMSDSQLQQQIESSLHSVPYGSGVHVSVSENEVHLAGTVANSKDKVDATRLAQSYSGNRLFKDDLQIAGSPPVATAQPSSSVNNATGSPPRAVTGNDFTLPKR